jgi:hypothetical protein
MQTKTIIRYVLVALIVLIIGALAGWYLFLRGQSQTTSAQDAARGFGASTPSANQNGSTFGNSQSTGGSASGSQGSPAQLWHVVSTPIAGLGFVNDVGGQNVHFVERSTGNILAANPATGAITRLTNTLIPKVYEAIIAPDGSLIERSLAADGSVASFAGSASSTQTTESATSSPLQLIGTILPKNIEEIAINPSTDELFYTTASAGGITGIRSQWNAAKQKNVFASPLSGWRITWLPDGRIILLEAPVDGISGYAYSLKNDGTLIPLVRAIQGLTILPRSKSSAMLYGSSAGGSITLMAQVSASSTPVQLPIKTIPDKCVWAPGAGLVAYCAVPQVTPAGNFLTSWYQGLLHTADAWWRVDASAGVAQEIYTPSSSVSLDVENPAIDASGTHIAFMNGADQSLWILSLNK